METLKFDLTPALFDKAKRFEEFRTNCKFFLAKHGQSYDKFTIVGHDSLIGYLTEHFIKDHLEKNFKSLKVTTWENDFDIRKIISILKSSNPANDDVDYVKNYFYDKWDLKLSQGDKVIYADVKTALTKGNPNDSWDFLYPYVQANKPGKDIMILVYYVVDDLNDLTSLKSLSMIGYTKPEIVRQCKIIRAGTKTKFGTTSQIDNYETQLSSHYSNVSQLFN